MRTKMWREGDKKIEKHRRYQRYKTVNDARQLQTDSHSLARANQMFETASCKLL